MRGDSPHTLYGITLKIAKLLDFNLGAGFLKLLFGIGRGILGNQPYQGLGMPADPQSSWQPGGPDGAAGGSPDKPVTKIRPISPEPRINTLLPTRYPSILSKCKVLMK